MNKQKINTKDEDIRQLMGNGRSYSVPKFQRDYTWDSEQWADLWDDIQSISDNREEFHYLGYLVLQEQAKNNNYIIIDGQQRLTTFSLIVLAAIKLLKKLNSTDERIELFTRNFIGEKKMSDLQQENKLKLNRNNDYYYREITEGNDLPQRGLTQTVKLMREALDYFYKALEQKYKNAQEIGSLVEKISARFLFTTIYIGDELNAYKIFETLNARGVRLSSADLLKNYIFSLIDNKGDAPAALLDGLDEKWEKIGADIGEQNYTDYILTEWNSRNKLVRKNMLFKNIRSKIKEKKSAYDYLNQLAQHSPLYSALLHPEDEFWKDHKDYLKIRKSLAFLKLFGIKQPMALLLISYQKFEDKFSDILKWIELFSFRYNIICRMPPNEQEQLYNDICTELDKGSAARKIKEMLLALNPSDDKFKQNFIEKTMPTEQSHKKARYIVARLASFERQDINETSLTIEHILPKNPEDHWVGYFGDSWRSYYQRLGNMALVTAQKNKDLGQKPFTEKKEILQKTEYSINHLNDVEEWNPEAIEQRQEQLATIALKLWKLS